MQVFWEKVGMLGPVYRLAGSGLTDSEIANRLDVTEVRVQNCVAWMQCFLSCKDRDELIQDASFSSKIAKMM
ncbi:MAG: hypothetical protein DMG62_01785 [Acidobacteria bacterium]|nr:MAG: hypothetical protein DMG62_01785 [Acidobacteriota bacterium]